MFQKNRIHISGGLMTLCTLLILLCAFTTGCGASGDKNDTDITTAIADTVYSPRYADGFTITASTEGDMRIITTSSPWQGDNAAPTRILLLDEGAEIPASFDGQVLRGVPGRVICMSSTHIAMLDALGLADRIVGVSSLPYITTPAITERAVKPVDVGYEGAINYEALAAARPDLVMLSAVNGPSSMEGKLRELGIPFIYVGDYMEESPLGKAEWCVALAELFGMRDKGLSVFSPIPQRYDGKRSLVASLPDSAKHPVVMLNAPYGDAWHLPPTDSYSVRLIKDAGGEVIWSNDTHAAKAVDLEEAYAMTARADIWLNPGMAASLAQLKGMAPKVADTKVFREGKVYNNNRRTNAAGGNAYFEEGVMQPDVILSDLIAILHPELVSAPDSTVYYHRLK